MPIKIPHPPLAHSLTNLPGWRHDSDLLPLYSLDAKSRECWKIKQIPSYLHPSHYGRILRAYREKGRARKDRSHWFPRPPQHDPCHCARPEHPSQHLMSELWHLFTSIQRPTWSPYHARLPSIVRTRRWYLHSFLHILPLAGALLHSQPALHVSWPCSLWSPITSLVGSTNYCGYLRVAFSTYITAPECDRNKSMTKSEEAFYKEWKSSIRRVMVGEKQDWIDEEYKPATKETILRTGPAGSNRTLNTRNGTAEGDRALELLRQAISARRDVTMAQEFGVRTAGSLGRSPRTKKGCYGVRPKTNLVE